jgi:DNA recombination protein RmuC
LSGKLDALGAAQDRQAGRVGRAAGVAGAFLANQLTEARAATDAALAAQRERLLEQEQSAGRSPCRIDPDADGGDDDGAHGAERPAGAGGAGDGRPPGRDAGGAGGAVAAQNEKLGRVLSDSAVKAEETAGKIHERLAVIDAARANMEALGAQVGSLAQILGNKQARGAFGEVQLRQLIEDRLPADGFVWQHTLANKTRCDCLIRLPHPPGPIAVDSKFPLEAWLAARDATDDAGASPPPSASPRTSSGTWTTWPASTSARARRRRAR